MILFSQNSWEKNFGSLRPVIPQNYNKSNNSKTKQIRNTNYKSGFFLKRTLLCMQSICKKQVQRKDNREEK